MNCSALCCSHFAITHKPWVWKLVGSTHDFFNGASMYAWMHQHTLGHHPYTNIDGADPDIRTGERVSIHCGSINFIENVEFGIDFATGCSTNQVAAKVVASLFLSAHLHSNALLRGKFKAFLCAPMVVYYTCTLCH